MAGNKQKVTGAIAVTPSDTVDLKDGCIGLLVGVAGDVEVMFSKNGGAVVLPLQAGSHEYEVTRVLSSNTTATGIVALY